MGTESLVCKVCRKAARDCAHKDTPFVHPTAPERIRLWVEREFNPKYHDCVTRDLIDVSAGNRTGNAFEKQALRRIFPECKPLEE